MANDTKVEKRVAKLFGRTAYRDIRDGFGGSQTADLTDQDVAAALGMVVQRRGRIAALVLETHYGSTMMHARTLSREWAGRECRPGDTYQRITLTRLAGETAIRELAGYRYGATEFEELAWLAQSRRDALQQRHKEAAGWLADILDAALRDLRRTLRDSPLAA